MKELARGAGFSKEAHGWNTEHSLARGLWPRPGDGTVSWRIYRVQPGSWSLICFLRLMPSLHLGPGYCISVRDWPSCVFLGSWRKGASLLLDSMSVGCLSAITWVFSTPLGVLQPLGGCAQVCWSERLVEECPMSLWNVTCFSDLSSENQKRSYCRQRYQWFPPVFFFFFNWGIVCQAGFQAFVTKELDRKACPVRFYTFPSNQNSTKWGNRMCPYMCEQDSSMWKWNSVCVCECGKSTIV